MFWPAPDTATATPEGTPSMSSPPGQIRGLARRRAASYTILTKRGNMDLSKTVACAFVVVLLGACGPRTASQAPTSSTVGDEPTSGSEVICTRERRPGSRTKIKVCRTAEERQAEREATERALRSGPGSAPVGERR